MKIPYLDLSVSDKFLKKDLLDAVDQVLSHGRVVLGPEMYEFEKMVSDVCGRKYAVGVSSGTDALYVAPKLIVSNPEGIFPLKLLPTLKPFTKSLKSFCL